MTAIRRTARGPVPVVVALAIAVGGCAGTPAAGATDDGREQIRTAAVQYASCMRERGYQVPDPTFDEQGLPRFAGPTEVGKRQDLLKDEQECRAGLNTAMQEAGIAGKEKATPEQHVAFTRCVREQGMQVADPLPGEYLEVEKSVLRSPAWPAAVEACRQHLPPGEADGLLGVGRK